MSRLRAVLLIGAGLLVATVTLFSTLEPDLAPNTANRDLGGLAAFAELLRREGYQVESSTRMVLAAQPEGTLVVTTVPAEASSLGRHLDRGGRALILSTEDADPDAALPTGTVTVLGWNGRRFDLVETGPNGFPQSWESDPVPEAAPLVRVGTNNVEGASLAELEIRESGRIIRVWNGEALTNRWIGEADHAAYGLWLVRQAAPPGSRIVFDDATAGLVDPGGLAGLIGPWARTARNQIILVVCLVLLTLFLRFGDARPGLRKAAGSRDMVDAQAELLQAGRHYVYAGARIADQADGRLRRMLGLGSDMPRDEARKRFSPRAVAAMRMLQEADARGLNLREVLQQVQILEEEVRLQEAESRRSRGLPA
ncbi:MAG: DUF4350 domain-containing protein [Fimbriimonadaceae bacterium]|nr:DUF4350 domain-containing protein [Fimbriimonadaceae bacterium]